MPLRVPTLAHHRRIPAVSTALVVVLALFLGAATTAPAQESTDLDSEYLEDRLEHDALLNENRQNAQATEQRLDEASVQLDALTRTATDLEAGIAALDGEIAAAQLLYDAELEAQTQAIRDAAAVRAEIAETQQELEAWEAVATERAVEAYISPVRTPRFVPYLQSGSMTELQRKMVILATIADSDAALLDGLRSSRAELDDRLDEQEYLEAKADEGRSVTSAARAELDAKRAEQEALRAELQARIDEFQAEVDALAAAQAELNRIIATREARFRAEAEARARWRDECAAGLTPVADDGAPIDCSTLAELPPPSSMSWPAAGVVSSEYGERWERMHQGLDIAAPEGTTIVAAEAGVVFFAGWLGGYGNTTIIDHGGGVMTLYGHQSSIWVSEQQQVVRGEAIGAMGSTGNSTGPHLHFETRVNGAAVNPRQFLG
jgi:murein DD-endopeptidase MepM/ murein hydrolase activator NlpD